MITETTFDTLLDHPQVTLLDPDLWAYVIDDVLTPEECQQWIDLAEEQGFGPAPTACRVTRRSSSACSTSFSTAISSRPSKVDGSISSMRVEG